MRVSLVFAVSSDFSTVRSGPKTHPTTATHDVMYSTILSNHITLLDEETCYILLDANKQTTLLNCGGIKVSSQIAKELYSESVIPQPLVMSWHLISPYKIIVKMQSKATAFEQPL